MTIKPPRLIGFAIAGLFFTISFASSAAPLTISGELDIVNEDNFNAIYSNTPLGTPFSGTIDDASFGGSITGNGITTDFSCCLAAGGLGVSNNVEFDQDGVNQINELLTINGRPGLAIYQAGTFFDIIDIEGDAATLNDGRIEIGVSYLFPSDTFDDESLDNYPFDNNDLILSVFFIVEEGGGAEYDALGLMEIGPAAVPLPAAAWLFPAGLIAGLGWMRRRNAG